MRRRTTPIGKRLDFYRVRGRSNLERRVGFYEASVVIDLTQIEAADDRPGYPANR